MKDPILTSIEKIDEESALEKLYATFHPLVIGEHRDHERVDRILRQVDVDRLPISVLIGFLTATFSRHDDLKERGYLFNRVKRRLASLGDSEVSAYLAGRHLVGRLSFS